MITYHDADKKFMLKSKSHLALNHKDILGHDESFGCVSLARRVFFPADVTPVTTDRSCDSNLVDTCSPEGRNG